MTPRSRLGAIGAALAILTPLWAGCRPAVAQVFAGTGAGVAMPGPQAPTVQAPALPATVVRHLPSLPGGLRLTGEAGDLSWPLYLTAAEAAGARRVRIGYSSAISVLPEASRIAVRINDHEIGGDLVEAPRGLRVIEFDIPPGLVIPGDNAVSLSVRQHHRVDCSVAATYELWTRIDPGQTGLVLASDASGVASLDELPALRPRPDGSLPIHVMLQGKLKPSHVERLMAATSAIALASRALQPVVDFDPSNLDDYGINLVVGPKPGLARDPRLAAVSGMAEVGASIIAAGAHGRPTLVVTGGTEDEIDGAIAVIVRAAPGRGSESGRLAARTYAGLATEGSESLRLRELGLHSEEFSGRFVRQSFELKLPADFLAADYGRGTFDLAGAYAAGLAPGSQVRLDVNGKSSGVIKLPNDGGDVFRHNQLFVPLRLMRPGLNRFDIYAETPRPADESCAGDDTKRFLFSDLSRITLPTFARVERRPDLAGMTAGGLPFADGPARLVVPKPDRATTAAALSIVARASVAAGKVIPFAFSTRMPSHAGGPTLVVSPAQALDPSLMAAIGLDPSEIEAAWRPVAAQALPATRAEGRWWLASNDGPAACRVPAVAQRIVPVPAQAAPRPQVGAEHVATAGDEDLLETWSEQRDHDGWLDAVEGYAERARAWVGDMRQTLSTRLAAPTRVSRISSDASIILAQGVDGDPSGAVTTIVTAPSSDILSAALPCLLDPQVWSGVHGRLAEVDASRGTVTAVDATTFRYVRGSQTSLGNARLVLAGWFSLDPLAFVAIAMLLALSLSGTTLWFVRGVGRTSE